MISAELPAPDSTGDLSRLFAPTSIAVVGASTTPGKLGTAMLTAVEHSAADGIRVVGINPKIDGDNHFHHTLADATRTAGRAFDLAVLCIPAAATADALRAAAACGVGGAVICSGGFAEVGSTELQNELDEIARATPMRLLGPNTSGFFRPGEVTVSFVPGAEQICSGPVAVVAASGGMNHTLCFLLSAAGIGVRIGIGLGNSVDVGVVDALAYVGADPHVRAIALCIESVDDGPGLLSTIRAVTSDKPVVACVTGRSDVSAFAASHTGALATSWRTTRSLLKGAGAVVVDTDQQLVDALAVLGQTRLSPSSEPGVGVVTAQAGPGLLILDQLLAAGVSVPPLSAMTQSTLAGLLPPMTFMANPVDTGRPGQTFTDVLTAAADDGSIDALAVYALAEPSVLDLAAAVGRSTVPGRMPVVVATGGPQAAVEQTRTGLARHGVPLLAGPTALVNGLRALVDDSRGRHAAAVGATDPTTRHTPTVQLPADEASAKDLLDQLGIKTPARRVCHSRDAAHHALDDLGAPVAVKMLDAEVLHKTEIGGVRLNVTTPRELEEALDALDDIPAAAYLIEKMADAGVDMILGARRDAVFGPIIVAGLGGTAAEAIGDVAISAARSEDAAARMIDELRCAPMLKGWRGGPDLDRAEFARIAVALAGVLAGHPEIDEIEINPLRLTTAGLVALDAVIVGSGGADNSEPKQVHPA